VTHVGWIDHSELRLDLSDVEECLVSISAYDPSARDLPPLGFGNQVWRTAAEYLSLAVTPGRVLHPDRLTQLFDNDNSLFDTYHLKCKPKRKDGYAPSSRGDTSARDFKLAVGAAKQNFALQETADLLIGCRAHNSNDFKRRDYYLRTIWRAREDAKNNGEIPPPEEQQEEQQQPQDDGEERRKILDSIPLKVREAVGNRLTEDELVRKALLARSLSRRFFNARGISRIYLVVLITKITSDPPQYEFYINNGEKVIVDGESILFNAESMQQTFFRSGYFMPLHKPAPWGEFIMACYNAVVEIPASMGTTEESEMEEYIGSFCRSVRLVTKPEDIELLPDAPLKDGSRIWIPVPGFLKWLKQNYSVSWSFNDFAKLADKLGYQRDRRQRGGVRCTRALVPEDVIDINEIVDINNNSTKRGKRRADYVVN
jgi:hypothetical protein